MRSFRDHGGECGTEFLMANQANRYNCIYLRRPGRAAAVSVAIERVPSARRVGQREPLDTEVCGPAI